MNGFRPNKGCHTAIKQLSDNIERRKIGYIVDADIKGFFNNVDHNWLMKCLEQHIQDPNILKLVKRFLKAGVIENGIYSKTEVRKPQGGVISTVLANLFLHYVFDDFMSKEFPNILQVRYADDGALNGVSIKQAKYIIKMLNKRFQTFGLKLNLSKTKIVYCKDDDRKEIIFTIVCGNL